MILDLGNIVLVGDSPGQINGNIELFLLEQGYEGTINDMLFAYLKDQGYNGTYTEMYSAFLSDQIAP